MEIFLCICGVLFFIFLISVRAYAWYKLLSSWIEKRKSKRKKSNLNTSDNTYPNKTDTPKTEGTKKDFYSESTNKPNQYELDRKKETEKLFEKMSNDIFMDGCPEKIIISINSLELFSFGTKTTLIYKDYISDCQLSGHKHWYYNDGSTPVERNFSAQSYFAILINCFAKETYNTSYSSRDITETNRVDPGSEKGYTSIFQICEEMTKE